MTLDIYNVLLSEAYLEPSLTSTMEFFREKN